MKLDMLIDELQEIVNSSKTVPISGKKMIDAERLLEIIDEMRTNVPEEVKQAKSIAADRTNILEKSRQEAENIVQQAEERAKAMVEHHEITRAAQQRAGEIINKANADAAKIRQAANTYLDNIMKKADDELSANLADLKKTRQSLKTYQQKNSGAKKTPPPAKK